MGLFDLIPGAKKTKKKIEKKLSTQTGKKVVLPKPSNSNVALGAASGALALSGAAASFVPGVGPVVGGALAAAGKATSALQKGDAKGAGLAALGALPGLGGFASKVPELAAAAKTVGAVASTVKDAKSAVQLVSAASAVDRLRRGLPVDAAAVLPSLRSLAGTELARNPDGLRVLADKVLAAQGRGGTLGAQAAAILKQTNDLARKGDASAKAALKIVDSVSAARAKAGIAKGAEQTATNRAASALASALQSATGLKVATPTVVVRSELAKSVFAPAVKTTAAAKKAAAAPKPAPAAAPSVGLVEQGFVLTADARLLDGTQWVADDAGGSEGVLVRTTGPAALRQDTTPRRWRRV